MKKCLSFLSAIVLSLSVLGPASLLAGGAGDAKPAVQVTREEAAKKFPEQKGKYADGIEKVGESTPGFIQSPYSSRVYDCRKIKKGSLVVDEPAKKAFVRN